MKREFRSREVLLQRFAQTGLLRQFDFNVQYYDLVVSSPVGCPTKKYEYNKIIYSFEALLSSLLRYLIKMKLMLENLSTY